MIWFTSDCHFWHTNVVVKYGRSQFGTIENMNETLIRNWNERVHPDDTIYVVGDFSLALRPVETITPRLTGRKKLIAGNHDWMHPAHKKGRKESAKWTSKYLKLGWESVELEGRITLKNGMSFRMHHMPYLNERDPRQNHKKYRPVDDGIPLLCGHVHTEWKYEATGLDTLMINVGVDQWNYAPVSEDELCTFLEGFK